MDDLVLTGFVMQLPALCKLVLTVFLLPHAGQQQTYTIQGQVDFEGGFKYEPIAVYLEALSSRPVEQVYVDVSGNFKFRDVPEGTYYIRVKHDGFEEFAQSVEVPAYSRDVSIFLQRKASSAPSQESIGLGGKFQVDLRQLTIPEKAVREYQKALDEDNRGETDSAVKRLRHALILAPNFIEAAFHLGSALYQTGHLDDAEKTLMQAQVIAPKDPNIRLMLTNVLVKERKYQQALSEIDSFLKENPNGAERESAETTRSQLIQAIKNTVGEAR